MSRTPFLAFALVATTSIIAPLQAQDQAWNQARASMVASQPSQIGQAISRWELLTANNNREAGFNAYAGMVLAYPDFPKQALLRVRAENALEDEAVDAARLVAFFDSHPPLTNPARARYALALASLQRPEALELARKAWREGSMSGPSEAYMLGLFGQQFTLQDHDARMDALLWQRDAEAAVRQINNVSSAARGLFMARLAMIQGGNPSDAGLGIPADAGKDAGFTYNMSRLYRSQRNLPAAISLLANRPAFTRPATDSEAMITEMLTVAESAGASQAVQIAGKTDDVFAPGYDVSEGSFGLRDKFTDLMWLGGTKALWSLGDGNRAAPLFFRYGTAAKTPLTRSKGFYWAGRAAAQAGDRQEAERYWSMAAQYPDWYYGQLALAELGRPLPTFAPLPAPDPGQVAAFNADPLTVAIREIARNRKDWRTERAFFSAIADKASRPGDMAMLGYLAQDTGLEEMAVVAGLTAGEHGLTGFERLGFPTVPTHAGANWTMVHAIARQESEFDRTRVSHAGARGMMQLMPGTAREEAGKIGVAYMSADLTGNPAYNIRLGDAHFARLMDRYGGAYPLAIAAYNAGPGRVNEWLRRNGDPRTGGIDWVTWIEKIPANFETRYYVMRVIGNAVSYANMHPDKSAPYQRDINHYLRR